MNKTQKNIVVVGFNYMEARSIELPKFGQNYYVNDMKEAGKHQGYLIIINNKNNMDIASFDKKYRKIINKYAYAWLYNENYENSIHKWSGIEFKNRDIFLYDALNHWDDFEIYKDFIEHKVEVKYTAKRLSNIKKIYDYLKDYQTIKTSQISADLDINPRTVERYMSDINQNYHNIGYDYTNNEWYMIW